MAKEPTPEQWAAAVLDRIGIKQSPGALQAMVGWAKAEGGHWNNDAKYNPLNTTQSMPGAGNTGSQGNIKVYKNWRQGIDATAKTLKNGYYGGILKALEAGDPASVAGAIGHTPWGTSGDLVARTIASTHAVGGVKPFTGQKVKAPASAAPAPGAQPYGPVETPGVDNSQARRQLVGQFLQQGGVKNQNAVLGLAAGYGQAQDVAATYQTSTSGQPSARISKPAVLKHAGAQNALSWAESKVGKPGSAETGENHGRLADYANSRFGMSGQPWCAMFTSLAVTKGGAPPSARTASVADVRRKALAGDGYRKGLVNPKRAKAGDLVLFGDRHIGMVKSVHGDRIRYVGGNQSDNVTEAETSAGSVDVVRPKYGSRK